MSELGTIVLDYPEMLKGTVGAAVLVLVGFVSARAVRRRMRYETWYYLHVLTYAAIFLAFGHQLALGADFTGGAAARAAWYALYLGVAALVLWFRVLVPVRLNVRHRLRVEAVVREAPGVTSVWVSGLLPRSPGSAAGSVLPLALPGARHVGSLAPVLPVGGAARRVPADHGEGAGRPQRVRRGPDAGYAGVGGGAVRGAHGGAAALAPGAAARGRHRHHAPAHALRDTAAAPGDLTLLYRARTAEELALRGELESIAAGRGARLVYVLNDADGTRTDVTADGLRRMLPDIAAHDVYLCGPHGLALASYDALREAGVPASRVHYESFEL